MEAIYDILGVQSGAEILIAMIDFAIVYFVLYRILLLIKGTRAVQILIGLIVVILFYFLSKNDLWTLPATNWFIDKFIANFIIIIVIIFQSDIRRALAHFGKTTFFSTRQSIEETQILEEVIKASQMLAARKIGALIAIERTADLNDFTDEGIRMDAAVSKETLFSVFLTEHQNPLHDGAVVIQKSRIAAAGCFLPLSNNPQIEKTLGTRHRAAIGLTEDTDAVVVVVSEERGVVSIAYREQLFADLDANEMRDMLQGIFAGADDEDESVSILERFRSRRDPATTGAHESVKANAEES